MEMPDFESVMEQMRSVSRKPSAFRKANTKPGTGYATLFGNARPRNQNFDPNNPYNPNKSTHIRGVSDTRSGKELQRGSGVDRKGNVSRGTPRPDPNRDKSPKGGNPFVGADGTVGQTRFRDFLQYNPPAKYYQPVSQNLGLRLENLAGNGVGTRRLWYLDWKGNPTADIGKARLMDKATGKVLTEPPMPMPVEEMLRRYQPVLSPMPALRMMGEDKDALGEAERARALELEKELALNSEVERVSRQSGLPEDAVREIIRDAVYSEVDSQELQRRLRHESASKESREQYEQYEKRANEILQQQIDTYNDYLQNPDKYSEEVEPPEFYYVPGTSTRPGYYSYRGAIRNIVNDLMKADNPNYIGNITPQALFDSLPAEYQFELASLTGEDLAMLLSKGITAKDLLKIPVEQVADRVDRMLDVPRTLGGTDVNDEYFDSIAADEAAFRDNEEKRWRELDILNRPTYAEMKARKEKEEEQSLFSQLFGKEQERGSITMDPALGNIQADLKDLDGELERAQRDYELAVQNLGEEKASRSKSAKRLEKMQVKRNALLKEYVRLGGTLGEDGRIPKEEIERAGKERGLISRLRGRSQFRDFERQLLEAIDESKTMPTQYLQDMGLNVGGHVPNPEVDRIYNNMKNHGSLTRNFKKRLGRVMNTLDFQRARDARAERRRNYKVPQTYEGAQPFEREYDPEYEAHLADLISKLKADGKLKPPVYDKPRGELTNMSEKKRMMEALYVQTMNKSGYSDSLQDAIDDVLFENSGKSWEGLRDTLFREFPMLRSPEDADKLEQIAIAFSHFDKASTDYNTWYNDQGINRDKNSDGLDRTQDYYPRTLNTRNKYTDFQEALARYGAIFHMPNAADIRKLAEEHGEFSDVVVDQIMERYPQMAKPLNDYLASNAGKMRIKPTEDGVFISEKNVSNMKETTDENLMFSNMLMGLTPSFKEYREEYGGESAEIREGLMQLQHLANNLYDYLWQEQEKGAKPDIRKTQLFMSKIEELTQDLEEKHPEKVFLSNYIPWMKGADEERSLGGFMTQIDNEISRIDEELRPGFKTELVHPRNVETPYVPAKQEHTNYAKNEARKLVEGGQLKRPDVDMPKDEKKEAERAAIASNLGRQDRKTPVQGVGNSETTSKDDLDYVPPSVKTAVDDAKENKERGSPRPTARQAMEHVDQVDRNKAKKQEEDKQRNLAKQKAQQDAEASAQEALRQKTQTDAEAAEVTRNQQATKRAELKADAGTLKNPADNQVALALQSGRIEEPETERKQASVFDMTEMMSIRDMMESIRKNDSKEGHPYGKPIQGNVFAYGSTQSTIGCERDIPMPDTIPTRKTNEEGATSRKLEL